MKIKVKIILTIMTAACLTARGQMVVSDPAGLAQSIVNTSKTLGESAATRSAVLENVLETQRIYEQTRKYYDYLKSVNTIIKDAYEVKHTIQTAAEITGMYCDCFSRLASDPLYSAEEIAAISYGYAKILERCGYTLSDLKNFLSGSSMSMTDKERLDAIEQCHGKMEHLRHVMVYYTRKVEAVSMVRQRKQKDLDGVIRLYGVMTDIEK